MCNLGTFSAVFGDDSAFSSPSFVRVIPAGVKAVSAGGYHSMVLKLDESVWATGSNKYGQFGNIEQTVLQTFVKIAQIGTKIDMVPTTTTPGGD